MTVQSYLTLVQKKYLETISEGEENALTGKDIALLMEVTNSAAYAMLGDLFEQKLVCRVGNGGRWDPYRYFKIKTKTPTNSVVSVSKWEAESITDPVEEISSMLNNFKNIVAERDIYKSKYEKLKQALDSVIDTIAIVLPHS